MLKASCLTLEINEFRCYEVKIEESEKAGSRTQDTSGLSRQCSATEPRQPDDHQPALAAQARGVLGLTPGDCRLFHFPLFSPRNIYIQL